MRTLLSAAAVLIAVFTGSASAEPVKFVLDYSLWPNHVLGDLGKKVYGGPGQQTSFTAYLPFDCEFNIWDWLAYSKHRGPNYSEIDYAGYCTFNVYGLRLKVGASYFDLLPQFKSHGDVIQGFVGVAKTFELGAEKLTLYLNAKPTFPIGFKEGLLTEFGFLHEVKFAERWTLQLGGRLIYDNGAYGNTDGWNGRGDLTLIYALYRDIDLKGGLRGFIPLSSYPSPFDIRRNELVGWAGLTKRFF